MTHGDNLDRYVLYLRSKLDQSLYCMNIMNNHRNWQSLPDYAFPCCKEIQELSNVSGRYNCGFRPITWSKLNNYQLHLPPLASNLIYLIAILSNESTRTQIEHNQYIIVIRMDRFNYSYELEIQPDSRVFNQYDPIMSTSREFEGQYGYQFINYADRLIQAILDDNLESLPESHSKYYTDVYLKSSQAKKQMELRKLFPFLTHHAIIEISQSETQSLTFYYLKTLINGQISQIITECLTEPSTQNLNDLKVIFPKLNETDLETIFRQEDVTRQYESLCQILQRPNKGLDNLDVITYTVDVLQPYLYSIDFTEETAMSQLFETLGIN